MTNVADYRVRISFKEYADWRMIRPISESIKGKNSGSGGDEDKKRADLQDEKCKYVYVFKKSSWGVSIYAELRFDESGNWKLVDWSKGAGSRWSNSPNRDKREATATREEFELAFDSSTECYYIFLSQVQLSYERLRCYLKGTGKRTAEELLERRALRFDPKSMCWKPRDLNMYYDYDKNERPEDFMLSLWEGPATADLRQPYTECKRARQHRYFRDIPTENYAIYLTDYLRLARQLHQEFSDACQDYTKYTVDDKRSSKLYLASLTKRVVEEYATKDDDARDWINWRGTQKGKEGLLTYLELEERQIGTRKSRRELWSSRLCELLQYSAYREMREDYAGVVESEALAILNESQLLEDLIQSERAQKYLESEVTDDASWYNRQIKNEAAFKALRRSEQVMGKLVSWLDNFAVAKIKSSEAAIESLEDFVRGIIVNTTGVNVELVSWPVETADDVVAIGGPSKYGLRAKPAHGVDVQMAELKGLRVRVVNIEKFRAALKVSKDILDRLSVAVELLNLVCAMKALERAKGIPERARAGLGLIAAISSLLNLTKALIKNMTAKTARFYGILGIVASVANYTRAVWSLGEEVWKGNPGLASSFGFTAIGATFGAMSGAVALGASGSLLGLTLTAASLSLIGAVFLAIGAVLFYVFYETPLERWLKRCEWGTKKGGNSIATQTHDLLHLITNPNVILDITGKTRRFFLDVSHLRLIIKPGFYIDGETRYKIEFDTTCMVWMESYGQLRFRVPLYKDNIVMPGPSDLVGRNAEGHVEYIVHSWEWDAVLDQRLRKAHAGKILGPEEIKSIEYSIKVFPSFSSDSKYDHECYEKKGKIVYDLSPMIYSEFTYPTIGPME